MTRPPSRSRSLVSRFWIALLVLCLWEGLSGLSHGGEYLDFWSFNKEFDHLVKVHQCEPLIPSHQKDYPFYDHPIHELATDEVFVAWCSVPPGNKETLRLFHLMVLTRASTHPWARCPKFIPLNNFIDPTHVWMERPTPMRGKTLSLHDLAYLDSPDKPRRPGPKGVKATGPSLWSGYRGETSWFLYCYQGSWLIGGEAD